MILTREQFVDFANENGWPDAEKPDHPIWNCEHHFRIRSEFFLRIKPIKLSNTGFWPWCGDNLKGGLLCYASSNDNEWWGFTHEDDIPLFILRWS